MITADSREPDIRVRRVREAYPQLKICPLEAGDWLLEGKGQTVALEVKTVGSFLSSMTEFDSNGLPRLYSQLNSLQGYEYAALVLIGDARPHDDVLAIQGQETGWRWKSYQNILFGLFLRGVPVLAIPTEEAFTRTLLAWHGLITSEPRPRQLKAKRNFDFSVPSPQVRVLSSFPLINVKGAESILASVLNPPSLRHALNLDIERLQQIPLIGPAKARLITETLDKDIGNGEG